MRRETAVSLLALSWSVIVTLYALSLTAKVAVLSETVSDLRVLLENATRTIRALRREVGGLENISPGLDVEVVVHQPVNKRAKISLRRGASALDAIAQVAEVAVKEGRIVSIDGVKGEWIVLVSRGGGRIKVRDVAGFALRDGDVIDVSLAGSNN